MRIMIFLTILHSITFVSGSQTELTPSKSHLVVSQGVGWNRNDAIQKAMIAALDQHIEHESRAENKALVSSKTRKVARGLVSSMQILKEEAISGGLYKVTIEAEIRASILNKDGHRILIQKELNRPSVKLNLVELKVSAPGLNPDLFREHLASSLNQSMLQRWFDVKPRVDEVDFTIALKGLVRLGEKVHSCGTFSDPWECKKVSFDFFLEVYDHGQRSLVWSRSLNFQDQEFPDCESQMEPIELLTKQVKPLAKEFFDNWLKRELDELHNLNEIEVLVDTNDFGSLIKLKKLMEDFYGVLGVRTRYGKEKRLEVESLVDGALLCELMYKDLSALGARVAYAGRNRIGIQWNEI